MKLREFIPDQERINAVIEEQLPVEFLSTLAIQDREAEKTSDFKQIILSKITSLANVRDILVFFNYFDDEYIRVQKDKIA